MMRLAFEGYRLVILRRSMALARRHASPSILQRKSAAPVSGAAPRVLVLSLG